MKWGTFVPQGYKSKYYPSRLQLKVKKSVMIRVVNVWNSQPADVTEFESLSPFFRLFSFESYCIKFILLIFKIIIK